MSALAKLYNLDFSSVATQNITGHGFSPTGIIVLAQCDQPTYRSITSLGYATGTADGQSRASGRMLLFDSNAGYSHRKNAVAIYAQSGYTVSVTNMDSSTITLVANGGALAGLTLSVLVLGGDYWLTADHSYISTSPYTVSGLPGNPSAILSVLNNYGYEAETTDAFLNTAQMVFGMYDGTTCRSFASPEPYSPNLDHKSKVVSNLFGGFAQLGTTATDSSITVAPTFGSNSYTITPSGTIDAYILSIAIGGGPAKVIAHTVQSSTGVQTLSSLGFSPKAAISMGIGHVTTVDAGFVAHGRLSLGMSDGSTHFGTGTYHKDNDGSAYPQYGTDTSNIIYVVGSSGTVEAKAALTLADPPTLNYTTASATAGQFATLFLGETGGGGGAAVVPKKALLFGAYTRSLEDTELESVRASIAPFQLSGPIFLRSPLRPILKLFGIDRRNNDLLDEDTDRARIGFRKIRPASLAAPLTAPPIYRIAQIFGLASRVATDKDESATREKIRFRISKPKLILNQPNAVPRYRIANIFGIQQRIKADEEEAINRTTRYGVIEQSVKNITPATVKKNPFFWFLRRLKR